MNSQLVDLNSDLEDTQSSCCTDEDTDNGRTTLNGFQLVNPMGEASFEKFLECPICFDICIPPVFVCTTGHHICEKCKQGMTKCCICSSKFAGGRNFFYENCVENSTFKCKYLREGCQEKLLGKEIKDHSQNCDYRPINCIRCDKEHIPYTKFLKHYGDSHKADIISPKDGEFHCLYSQDFENTGIWRVSKAVEFDGHTFFPIARQSGAVNPRIGLFVRIFGNRKDERKYNVKISLETKPGNIADKKPKYWSGWEGPVVSIRKDAQEILDAGKCFLTSPAAIKTTCAEQTAKFWSPKFKITPVGF